MKILLAITLTCALVAAQSPQRSPQTSPVEPQPKADLRKAPERRVTPEQAQALFNSIDDVFQFASRDSGLPIRHEVKKKLADRDEVERYVTRRMQEDKDTQRLERSEVVLKKFGLLPRDFDLRPFLVKLMRDQVAGFYDAKTKTVYLLDWVDPEIQKPVMAHELTHALQDQNFDLEKWASDDERDKAEKQGDYNRAVRLDEISMAQTAMIEGQGMITFLDYALRGYGVTVEKSPGALDKLAATMGDDQSSEVLSHAPLSLRESLIFPYRDGMRFVGSVLTEGGKDAAFRGLFLRPPTTSHEIMVPREYLSKRKQPVVLLPDVRRILGSDYTEYDVGAMGQFDTALVLREFVDSTIAEKISEQWAGGSYYAAMKKGSDPRQTASIHLFYASRWRSADAASNFREVYESGLKRRYREVRPAACSGCTNDEKHWITEEGPILLKQHGTTVSIAEGFDEKMAADLVKESLDDSASTHLVASESLASRAIPAWIRAMIAPTIISNLNKH